MGIRHEGYVAKCDRKGCYRTIRMDVGTFVDARKLLRSYGWKASGGAGGITLCGKHAEHGRKKL